MATFEYTGISSDFIPAQLPSKEKVCTIANIERRKPVASTTGYQRNLLDSDEESCKHEELDTFMLHEPPNLYKNIGAQMENLGYFHIPRSVTSDIRYQQSSLKYQKILNKIFEHVAFAPTTHAIGAALISIEIGQLCITLRGLVDLCNQNMKREEDLVDKSLVERALRFFEKCDFSRQETRHGKTIITIVAAGYYRKTETTIETKSRQGRDTKEEYKELKEEEKRYSKKEGVFTPSAFATALLSEFESSLLSSIPDFEKSKLRRTKSQYQAADRLQKKCKGDLHLLSRLIKFSHTPGGFWLSHVHSLTYLDKKFTTLLQQLRNQDSQRVPQVNQPKFNQDESQKNLARIPGFLEES